MHLESAVADDPTRPWVTRPRDPEAIAALRQRIQRRRDFGVGLGDLSDPDQLEAERLAAVAGAGCEP